MIRRVYERALQSSSLDTVVVATDDQRILEHVEAFGGNVVMTGSHHTTGTERCLEAAGLINANDQDVIINIQGDEPFMYPEQIDQVAGLFTDPGTSIATLIKAMGAAEDASDPNRVKVVVDARGNALYFSRSAIPFQRSESTPVRYKHLGIYGYRMDVLKALSALTPTPLEKAEMLEQLRWLEHGLTIRTEVTLLESPAIDRPEDVKNLPPSLS